MTADLADWFSAQLDADEAVARKPTAGPWEVWPGAHGDPLIAQVGRGHFGAIAMCSTGPDDYGRGNAEHIALHDPAFELDCIAALRAVVELHGGDHLCPRDSHGQTARALSLTPCPTLLALAQPYRDRPGWRDEWTVGE